MLSILTFNIRLGLCERGTPDAWIHRADTCVDIVRRGGYDFVGLQEVIWNPDEPETDQAHNFRDGLPEYGFLGRARDPDPAKGEGVAVLYRRDRWEPDPAEQGVFWLSETPDVPASRSWDTLCPRTFVWALFHELGPDGRRTGRTATFCNAHLDHIFEHTQLAQAQLVSRFLDGRRARGENVVLVGDFNAYEKSWPVRHLLGDEVLLGDVALPPPAFPLRDAWREANPDAPDGRTWHNWGQKTNDWRIDYILFGGALDPVSATVDRERSAPGGRYPSDHYPVSAILRQEGDPA